ncbi:MAG TPA: hypothetical protein VLT33_32670 [Labilithrix sp.]|nr:hypothetical protein [Labilithrix sp.]
MGWGRSVVGAIAGTLIPACTLVTNLDGLAGDPPVAPETGTEGSTGDTGGPDVVTADAVDSAPDAGSFCTAGHTFCADFDEGALSLGWTRQHVDAKAAIELSTAHFTSPTSSFHASVERRAANDLENALLGKELTGSWRRLVVAFDVLIEGPAWQSGDSNAAFLAVYFDGTGPTNEIYFPVGNGYAQVTGPGMNIPIDAPPVDRFFHVRLDIEPGVGVSVEVNGKAYQGTPSAFVGGPGLKTVINLGITGYNAPVPAFSAFYDNVVIDQQ